MGGFDGAQVELGLRYWGIRELGDMHHNPDRKVLHVDETQEELASTSGLDLAQLGPLLERMRRALLAVRRLRPTPFIDRTLYTGWNAMAVTAYLEAARVLRLEPARLFALRTLDRLLNEAWDGEQTLGHVIAYGSEGPLPAEEAPGTLDDYAFTVHALIDA
jgi:uncharacterized protein YyaL (SSP411 family)